MLAYALVTLASITALLVVQNNADRQIYLDAVNSCERTNVVRAVVWENTVQAAAANPDATYGAQLKLLRSVEGVRPDGTIDCEAVITVP